MTNPFLGQIDAVPYNFDPRSWASCAGQLLPIAQYSALFSLLGTTYGGDGITTFALPDLRGRIPVHYGTGPGLSTVNIGAKGGTETETLTTAALPAHNHSSSAALPVQSGNGEEDSPEGHYHAAHAEVSNYAPTSDGEMAGTAVTLTNTGGSQAHDNMMPYTVVRYVIALQGIFPSRS